jgi:hypothetical protein
VGRKVHKGHEENKDCRAFAVWGGPAGENGQPGAAEAGANQSDGGPTGPKHYYYDGKDLGTVAQHEQYCRLLRDQLDAEGVNDQDKLEAEGCRGGGSIGSP